MASVSDLTGGGGASDAVVTAHIHSLRNRYPRKREAMSRMWSTLLGMRETSHLSDEIMDQATSAAICVDVEGMGAGLGHPNTFTATHCLVHFPSNWRIAKVSRRLVTITQNPSSIEDPKVMLRMLFEIAQTPQEVKVRAGTSLALQTASGDSLLIPLKDTGNQASVTANLKSAHEMMVEAMELSDMSTSEAVRAAKHPFQAVICPVGKITTCDLCGVIVPNPLRCSRCKNKWYCDKLCQLEDWRKRGHKFACKPLTDETA